MVYNRGVAQTVITNAHRVCMEIAKDWTPGVASGLVVDILLARTKCDYELEHTVSHSVQNTIDMPCLGPSEYSKLISKYEMHYCTHKGVSWAADTFTPKERHSTKSRRV